MSRRHGPWTVLERRSCYRGPFVELVEDDVIRPDGAPGTYATVQLKPGVSILPRDETGAVHLIRQFRYALGHDSLEVVCGGLEGDEPPLDAARRELREELGGEAAHWHAFGSIDLDTSIVTAPAHLFLAEDLRFRAAAPEGTERVQPVRLAFADALARVAAGEITHAATVVLLLRVAMELH